jgi:GNAT superfamily N-acetyltransferase
VKVSVRQWDPASAPTAEIEALVGTLNAALDADLPDDPRWDSVGVREYLAETMPGERRFCWLGGAPAGGGPVAGHANLLVLGDFGVVEVLVHPARRRTGVGRALLEQVATRAQAEGLASIGVEAVGDTPAAAFWEAVGFRCAYVELRSVLNLSTVDWAALREMADAAPVGYRIECYRGTLPPEWLEPYAAAKAIRRGSDPPDLALRPSSYDADRLAASMDTLNRRGMTPYLVMAVHEGTGDVAALTEVVAPVQRPSRGDQYDTIVIPEHQGLGLDRVIKARMLLELSAAEPRLTEVQTWNALENDPMTKVNEDLGFRPDRQWCEYEADVAELIAALGHRGRTGRSPG